MVMDERLIRSLLAILNMTHGKEGASWVAEVHPVIPWQREQHGVHGHVRFWLIDDGQDTDGMIRA